MNEPTDLPEDVQAGKLMTAEEFLVELDRHE